MEYSHSSQEANTNSKQYRGQELNGEAKNNMWWTDIKAMKEESAKHSAQNASRLAKDLSGV